MASATSNASYWDEYSNLQRIKHELIRQYLNGWFPMLASWSGRVLYFDTHAGRGRHGQGHLGSPLIALKTLLEHASRPRLLAQSEAVFFFIERDDENVAALHEGLKAFEPLPPKVTVKTISGDCFQAIESLLQSLDQSHERLAPAFVDWGARRHQISSGTMPSSLAAISRSPRPEMAQGSRHRPGSRRALAEFDPGHPAKKFCKMG